MSSFTLSTPFRTSAMRASASSLRASILRRRSPDAFSLTAASRVSSALRLSFSVVASRTFDAFSSASSASLRAFAASSASRFAFCSASLAAFLAASAASNSAFSAASTDSTKSATCCVQCDRRVAYIASTTFFWLFFLGSSIFFRKSLSFLPPPLRASFRSFRSRSLRISLSISLPMSSSFFLERTGPPLRSSSCRSFCQGRTSPPSHSVASSSARDRAKFAADAPPHVGSRSHSSVVVLPSISDHSCIEATSLKFAGFGNEPSNALPPNLKFSRFRRGMSRKSPLNLLEVASKVLRVEDALSRKRDASPSKALPQTETFVRFDSLASDDAGKGPSSRLPPILNASRDFSFSSEPPGRWPVNIFRDKPRRLRLLVARLLNKPPSVPEKPFPSKCKARNCVRSSSSGNEPLKEFSARWSSLNEDSAFNDCGTVPVMFRPMRDSTSSLSSFARALCGKTGRFLHCLREGSTKGSGSFSSTSSRLISCRGTSFLNLLPRCM
mmetsp:Transcript_3289/g.9426  ORF Transcript_3289/g.9426 Transcript_3289/m.9426 type:complete len:498 (-) Transcript_3289:371-1864(-)